MGGSAPEADPAMGEAALMSAELGNNYFEWMQEQSVQPQEWATEGYDRYQNTFLPLQDQMIADAQSYDTPERRQAAVNAAQADVQMALATGQQSNDRRLASMGVNPASGRSQAESRRISTDAALASAGAANNARTQVENQGYARMGNAVNLGQGMGVNPAAAYGLSTGTMGQGFQGAINGQGQAANIYGQQHQAQMQTWQANQSQVGGLFQGLGALGGLFFASSKDYKTDKKPIQGARKALDGIPVEQWRYKDGHGDGGEHIGAYAEDFQRETGMGDGKSIGAQDAIGITMAAVKEISAEVVSLRDAVAQLGEVAA